MPRRRTRSRRAVTRCDVVAGLLALAVLGIVLGPMLAATNDFSARGVTLQNLRVLHEVQTCYAADWDDRQFTAVPDDWAPYAPNCAAYAADQGCFPPLTLGWAATGLYWYAVDCPQVGIGSCSNRLVAIPLSFNPNYVTGSYRFINARPLHDYHTGRFYDRVFYAPGDRNVLAAASPYFDETYEFSSDAVLVPSSYILSPAAMFDPGVLRPRSDGGFQDPKAIATGYRSVNVSQIRYASRKTRTMEHHWIDGPPANCNPSYTDPFAFYPHACSPYLFNHDAAASPGTLFFDGSVRFLSTGLVSEQDRRVLTQTGGADGLWSRDTPLGPDGYFGAAAVDDTRVSHHILTTGGPLGYDVTADPGTGARR